MPRIQFITLIVVFAVAAILFTPHRLSAETKVLNNNDSGSEVHLKVGDRIELHLRSNPSTGYMWYEHKESTPLLKLVSQSETVPDTRRPGAGNVQIFSFEPRSAGDGTLLLHYVRSWAKPSPDETQFKLHVIIE